MHYASTRSREYRNAFRFLLFVALATLTLCLHTGRALAAPLSASSTSASSTAASQSTALPGVALSEGDGVSTLRVSVSTSVGTLSMANNPSGLTLATGFSSWSNASEIAFTGVRDNINAALATLTINPGANAGSTAVVQINAQPFVSGMAYSPTNGHYYQYVESSQITFAAARTDAATKNYGGQTGYLASIPSAEINDLIADKIPGATNVWFGASATNASNGGDPVQRTWTWTDGPLAATAHLKCSNLLGACTQVAGPGAGGSWPLGRLWADGEPNNWSNIESAAVTNWSGAPGEWNDLSPTENGSIDGYIVEFGDQASGSSTPFTGTAAASANVAVLGPAGPPTGISVTTHGDKATVSWTPPSNNGGQAIVSYTATASGGGGSCTVTAPATSCTIDGLTIGGGYTFTVTADNGLGSSGSSSPSSPVTPTVAVPEPATDASVALVDDTTALVSWSPSTDDGGGTVTYTVIADPGGQSCTSAASFCTISGLEPGREYTFSITATNSAGSAISVSAKATTPAAPSAVVAGPPPVLSDVRFAKHNVRAGSKRANLLSSTAPKTKKRKRRGSLGTYLSLTSSEAAIMRVQLVRNIPGRMSNGKCRPRRRFQRDKTRCAIGREIAVATTGVSVQAGANRYWFSGRLGARRLAPGLYHLKFTLVDADGNVSNSRGDWVRVIRRR